MAGESGPCEDRQGNVRTAAAVEDSQGGANRGGVCPGLAWQDRLGVARSVKVSYGTARQAWQVELGRGSVLVSLVTDWQERKGWSGMGMEWLGRLGGAR